MKRVTAADSQPDRTERDYTLLMEGMTGHAVLVLDSGGHVLGWNAVAQRLLGYGEDEVRGEHFCFLFFRPEEVRRGEPERELKTAAAQGQASGDRWYVRKDGTALWCGGSTSALRDRDGRLLGFVKVLGDRTAWKQQEWQPGHAWAEAEDSFSRELRDLLVIIHGCKEFLVGHLGLLTGTGARPSAARESRNPKHAIRNKSEARNPKPAGSFRI
jgi:PAS domain S-box-containing protein